jgi:Flp pilus assembly protein TadD
MRLSRVISGALCLLVLCSLVFSQSAVCAKDIDWDKELQTGYQQLTMGNSENAQGIFSKKVKKYPTSAACHTALGRAYKRLGKIDEAKGEFIQATKLDSNYADGFYELGVMQESDKQWLDASEAFQQYLRLKPSTADRKTIADRIQFCKSQLTDTN